jgi:hypothetical protein
MPLINILLLNQHAVGRANVLVSIIAQPLRPFGEGIAYLLKHRLIFTLWGRTVVRPYKRE